MQRGAAILIVLSVIFIALFGFNSMHAANGGHSTRCFASMFTAAEPPCPQSNVVGFIGYHLDAFKSFSLATLIGALLFFIALVLQGIAPEQPLTGIFAFEGHTSSASQQFRSASEWRWYSLHEHSPSVI